MGWSSSVLNNLNLMALLLALPLFVSLVFKLLSLTFFHKRERYSSCFKQLLGGYFFCSLIFLTPVLFFSIGTFINS